MCAAIQVECYFNGVVGLRPDLAYAIKHVFTMYITLTAIKSLRIRLKRVVHAF